MYTKVIPFKDYKGNPRNMTVHLNLDEREFFKLFPEFYRILTWRDSLISEESRDLSPDEVRDFYNDLEEVLLTAWGIPSEDGLYFRKTEKYDFQESALFNALMMEFVTNPSAANEVLKELMPSNMEDMIKKFEGNLDKAADSPETPAEIQAKIRALQAQLPTDSKAE